MTDIYEAHRIRSEMDKEGWSSCDTSFYSNGYYLYCIRFERDDWHGKKQLPCKRLPMYYAQCNHGGGINGAVIKAAELARRAWNEFPDVPPIQEGDNLVAWSSDFDW